MGDLSLLNDFTRRFYFSNKDKIRQHGRRIGHLQLRRLNHRALSSQAGRGQLPSTSPKAPGAAAITTTTKYVKRKEENEGNEGSKKMREAAEQMNALSHVRDQSDETLRTGDRPCTSLPDDGISEARRNELPSYDPDGSDDGIDHGTIFVRSRQQSPVV